MRALGFFYTLYFYSRDQVRYADADVAPHVGNQEILYSKLQNQNQEIKYDLYLQNLTIVQSDNDHSGY